MKKLFKSSLALILTMAVVLSIGTMIFNVSAGPGGGYTKDDTSSVELSGSKVLFSYDIIGLLNGGLKLTDGLEVNGFGEGTSAEATIETAPEGVSGGSAEGTSEFVINLKPKKAGIVSAVYNSKTGKIEIEFNKVGTYTFTIQFSIDETKITRPSASSPISPEKFGAAATMHNAVLTVEVTDPAVVDPVTPPADPDIGWLQLPSNVAYPDGGPGLPSGGGSAVTTPGTDQDANPGTGPVEVASAVALFGTVSALGAAFVVAKKKYDR